MENRRMVSFARSISPFSLVALVFASSCESPKSSSVEGGPAPEQKTLVALANSAKLQISLSEVSEDGLDEAKAPATYVSAEIEVREVRLRSSSEGRWYRIPITPGTLELFDLSAGLSNILARAKAPAGSYDEIRLITAEAGSVVDSSGNAHELFIPSGAQSGLKIKFSPEITLEPCMVTEAEIAFDLSKSFVATAHNVHFKPVLHADSSNPAQAASCEEPGNGSGSSSSVADNSSSSSSSSSSEGGSGGGDGSTGSSSSSADSSSSSSDGGWEDVIGI
jgi:hypothetical protein